MAITGRTVIGVFDEPGNADRAIDALQSAGFSSSQIHHSGRNTATTTGTGGGGFFASVKNFFTGEDSTSGSSHVANDLTGMGVSSEESKYYENEYNNGRTVVSINAGDRAEEAKTIMDTNGAYNYNNQRGNAGYTSTAATTGNSTAYTDAATTGNSTAYTDAATTGNTTAYTDAATTGFDRTRDAGYTNETDEQRALRLRSEQLNVNKQNVQSGEVDVRKEVISEQKTVDVPVTHEEVYIENRPVTDQVTDDATPIGEGESIRVPVSEEKVNVSKDTVVTGEVSIGKRAVQETQQVTDTVRHEEARLDKNGNPSIQGNIVNDNDTQTDRTDTRNSY